MSLTCAAALGADDEPTSGFRNVSVDTAYNQTITLTPLTDKDMTVTVSEGNYPGAVKMEIVYNAAQKDSEYALFVLTENKAPTVDNIAYIDQQTAKDNTVTFTAYPKKLSATTTAANYYVYISSNTDASSGTGITGYTQTPVATFSYYAAATVILGDLNDDEEADITDAFLVLKLFVAEDYEANEAPTEKQRAAADVNLDGEPDMTDAFAILQYSVGVIESFEEVQ